MAQKLVVSGVGAVSMTRQEFIDVVQNAQPFAGTALAALDSVDATGPLVITNVAEGFKQIVTTPLAALAELESVTTLTGTGAISVATTTTNLNAASGSFTLTLADGTFEGQRVNVNFVQAGSTATWTLTAGNLDGFTTAVFSLQFSSGEFRWSAAKGKWQFVGGSVLLS